MQFDHRHPPAAQTTIDLLLPLFQGSIPLEYRDFLQAQDGCEVRMLNARHPKGWRLRFLSVAEVLQEHPVVAEMYYQFGEPQAPDSFAHAAIATDDSSNYLAYDLRVSMGDSFQISLVDHDQWSFGLDKAPLYKRADNLIDLLDQLQRGVFAAF